jgi:acetate kinase
MRILVVNSGSSSLKLRLVEDGATRDAADLPAIHPDAPEPPPATREALERFTGIDAVGHRIVHGGTAFTGAVRLDRAVVEHLEDLANLAPLHQPACLAGWRWVSALLPAAEQYACFDTAFHATLPPAAATYPLPRAWRERWPLRRFGFHGLSHAYAARRAAELLGRPVEELRLVTAHLGAGASLAAVDRGRSVDTTMGFTPLDGLVMATRSGAVDPGLVLWLQQHGGLSAAEVEDGLEHRAGILGVGGTADMRTLLAAVADGSEQAQLALDVYVHRLRAGIAAMTAAMGGIDAVVFTGGVGEHAPTVRALALERLGFLGLELDPGRNAAGPTDREIGAGGASARVLVVESHEELEIARQVRALVGADG